MMNRCLGILETPADGIFQGIDRGIFIWAVDCYSIRRDDGWMIYARVHWKHYCCVGSSPDYRLFGHVSKSFCPFLGRWETPSGKQDKRRRVRSFDWRYDILYTSS